MEQQKLPKVPLQHLRNHCGQIYANEVQWEAHLQCLGITRARHRRIATEGALLGSVLDHGFSPGLAIISDDAGQFNVLLHGLCWVHAERLVHKLIPLNEAHRQDIASARNQIWSLYAELLLVLERPDVPLHTNGSEGDVRDYVKKNKVSGGTRSDTGRRCRDTFTSLKKTCRKLGVSFWGYLTDRISRVNEIPRLAELVELKAAPP